MKRLFTLLLGATFGCGIQAQYLPNTGFEAWKEVCGSSYQSSKSGKSGGAEGFRQRPGTEPMDWNGSSVNQKVWAFFYSQEKQEELITQGVSRNGTKSVVLTNKFVGVGNIGSNAPAFITFGTPWVYAVSTIEQCDGGVYGGTNFTFRPDAIRGWYKRTPSTEGNENAHIIAYLWKGTYSSGIKSHTTNDIKEDVDRVVMGKESGTANGTLIASCDYGFATTTNNDWQEIIVPLNYEKGQENTIPEKMNVIISSADYWTRANIKDQSILEVDDVQYLYYSQLAELSYDGKSIDGFSKDKYEYTITADYDESKLSAKADGIGAIVEKSYDEETHKLTITVKGNDISANTENFHTYTLEFKQAEEQIPLESTDYSGFLTVTVNGNSADSQITTIRLIKNTDASYSFALDNFILGAGEDAMPIGNILLKNLTVSEDGNSFTANQTIQITEGDKEGVTSWLGPQLGDVPVVLSATKNGDNMTADIDIDMTNTIGQIIKVSFAPELVINGTTTLEVTGGGLYNVTLSRNFAANWNTICLPFDTTPTTLGATQVQAFTACDGTTLTFTKTESMMANTPYLIYFEKAPATPLYISTEIKATVPTSVTHGNVTFVGNYEAGKNMEGLYGVAEKAGEQYIMRGGKGSTLGSTGAYFTVSGSEVNTLRIRLEGTGTGISDVEAGKGGQTFDIYSLNGIKVRSQATTTDGLPKGIYLINGKKHIVK
ncbi:calycin-like domain-containing protein [Paraprevotella clara]|uniref:calycin-like domain-containing protein n=1 Tax=Paraprevotella clara TaxID=454154 RepID=UPI0024203D35|nr:calycin-like domain-containing protein [Paraprevotella clara]MBD9174638.1 hypothetical protein [Paraprevotella clara]